MISNPTKGFVVLDNALNPIRGTKLKVQFYDFRIEKHAMVPKWHPMAQTNNLGIVYGLVNDKQLNDSNSVLHHCMK